MKKSVFIQKLSLLSCCNHICGERELVSGAGEDFSLDVVEKASGNIRYLTVTIENTSGKDLVFTRAFVRADLAPGPYEYFAQHSRWSAENQGVWAPLNENGLLLSHRLGRTTEGNTPFIAFRGVGEECGTAFHVVPNGNWRIRVIPEFFSNEEPILHVDLGIRDEELAYRLAPGEKWVLPPVLIQDFATLDDSCPELHKFLRENFVSKLQKKLPVIYNTWLDRFAELDVAHLREELAAAKEVGCEIFIIDAGWFGNNVASWGGVGDWYEKEKEAFHGKMKEFADEVRAAGLGFGLWMEPERIAPGTYVVEKHSDWLVSTGSQYRYDLTNPEAYEFLKGEFRRLITTYDIAYMKTDMNDTLGHDSYGTELYAYQSKFLQLLGEIKAEFPSFIVENCSSGAMRADLATLQNFDLMFCSDNANGYTMLDSMHGFFYRMLPGRILRWVTVKEVKEDVHAFGHPATIITPGEATWEEYERCDLESCLIANFTGVFGFSGSLASLSAPNRELVKKYITLFKEKRSFMRDAASRFLVDRDRFKVFQQELDGEVIVSAFYISRDKAPSRRIYPKALREEAVYCLNGENTGRTGKDIMENGLEVELVPNQHYSWRAVMLQLTIA